RAGERADDRQALSATCWALQENAYAACVALRLCAHVGTVTGPKKLEGLLQCPQLWINQPCLLRKSPSQTQSRLANWHYSFPQSEPLTGQRNSSRPLARPTPGEGLAGQIEFVCSDMWRPYLTVIRERCSQAIHILDRFHIVAKMNTALDQVRAGEARRPAHDGHEPGLKKTRWGGLKGRAHLTGQQQFRLRDLLGYHLPTRL